MPYVPSRPVPQQWFTTPCPYCPVIVRSALAHNMRRALSRHMSEHHKDIIAPEPEPPAPFKVIAIVAVHFSGSRKRLGHAFDGLKQATVPSAFPGESGVAVVRGDGGVVVYAKFAAGETAYIPAKLEE